MPDLKLKAKLNVKMGRPSLINNKHLAATIYRLIENDFNMTQISKILALSTTSVRNCLNLHFPFVMNNPEYLPILRPGRPAGLQRLIIRHEQIHGRLQITPTSLNLPHPSSGLSVHRVVRLHNSIIVCTNAMGFRDPNKLYQLLNEKGFDDADIESAEQLIEFTQQQDKQKFLTIENALAIVRSAEIDLDPYADIPTVNIPA